jgi:predicted DNA-binding transcriptional regulator AlpA
MKTKAKLSEHAPALGRQLRYRDLEARGVVCNRTTLTNWMRDRGFPKPRAIGNTLLWDEAGVVAWLMAQTETEVVK